MKKINKNNPHFTDSYTLSDWQRVGEILHKSRTGNSEEPVKTSTKLLFLFVVIILIAGSWYFVDYKPAQIKKGCSIKANNFAKEAVKIGNFTDKDFSGFYEVSMENCMENNGAYY